MANSAAAPTELGSLKISKLLRMYAVPGIIAQTAASLYNVVDRVYIGHIPGAGDASMSALGVSFPLMNLAAAMGTLVGVGAMTMISVMLGQKKYDSANKVLANVLWLNVIIGVLFTLVTLPFAAPILKFFGATDTVVNGMEPTLPYAMKYMTIILAGNVITHLYFGFNGIIRASGSPKTAMFLTVFTVALNAVLDPLFIFTFGMGIQGAALATVICQALALVYSLRFFSNKKRFLHFPDKIFRLNYRVAIQSMKIGMSPFLMNVASCIVNLFINQQLLKYDGPAAIADYGVVNTVTFIFFMVCMGFNQGLQPIAGYNYGAKLYSRVKEIFFLTMKWEVLVMSVCFLISEFLPELAVSAFLPGDHPSAVRALRICNAAIFLVGFGAVVSNFFQCLGMVKVSIFLSLSRQLIFLLPVLYILPEYIGADGVWISFPVSDAIAAIVSAIMLVRLFRKFDRLEDGGSAATLGSAMEE